MVTSFDGGRIKEQQLDLFADHCSGHLMRVNQMRLWLASMAYVLLSHFRGIALAGTTFARARCSTIQLKLLKIGYVEPVGWVTNDRYNGPGGTALATIRFPATPSPRERQ